MDVPKGKLHLGAPIDPATNERAADPLLYDAAHFTTHGVIVGMTGSGKTGLGIVTLEEALRQGIPTLVIDPKGDMTNLALRFPDLAPADFEPWIDPTAAQRDGVTVAELAASTATTWRDGLASWDLGPADIGRLCDIADVTVYTPGSAAGVPLNILGSLDAPASGTDPETLADEIEGIASSLLGLVGIDADPLSSREHILLANLIHDAWGKGESLDLGLLIGRIQQPPLRKLGVIDLDTFFPPADRMALAMKLNGLAASPAFAAWIQGEPLDIDRLLYTADGRPRCAVVTISHLNDEERQFVVTLLLAKVVSWMRALPGSAELRALIYMDEVFGFVPPSAMPPAKKPILTIFKQARAFGVGMILSTQNPVDIDYKAISNAGTWMIGRLQTERDKARLLEGMTSAAGAVDIAAVDATISGLGKRQFLLQSSKANAPQVFTTRWALSYLAGPLTRDQIAALRPAAATPAPAAAPSPAGAATADAPVPAADAGAFASGLADDETPTAPTIAEGRRAYHLDPAASWAGEVGAVAGGTRLEPALVTRVRLLFDETKVDLRHEAEWEAVIHPLGTSIDPAAIRHVDYDDRDLTTTAPPDARYVLTDARLDTKTYFRDAETLIRDQLYRTETLTLFQNTELKLASRAGEGRDDFATRCVAAADDLVDAEAAKLRKALETKIDRVRDAIAKAEDQVREAEADAAGRKNEEVLSGIGDVLGSLLGGRKSTRSILSGVRRAGSKRRTREKAAERVATAENRLLEKVDELEALEAELAESLEDLQELWEDKAAQITELAVPLEKTDITVEELAVLWIPTRT